MAEIETVKGLMNEARHFWSVIKTNPSEYQVTAEQAEMLNTLTTETENSFSGREAAENELANARTDFREDFAALSKFFRPLRQSVKDNPATTEVQRSELHLLISDKGDSLIDNLKTAPLLLVEQTGIGEHTVRFFMPSEDARSTKKPPGVYGCKLYLKIGDAPPASLKDCALITIDSKSPYKYDHEPEDTGKKAHYIGVWVDKEDATSPQSETFTITIG